MYSDTICIKYTRKWRWMQVPAKNKAKRERKTVFSQKRVAFYEEIVKRLTQGGRLICIDRDSQAIEAGKARLAPWAGQITFLHGNFGDLAQLLDGAGIGKADGMLFDLGVSSPQLDDPERGFSYMHDAPLDMRMDRDDALTAWTVVNQWPRTELRRILSQYGEEKYAGPIAAAIERAREKAPIETTGQLVEVIRGGDARRGPAGKAAPGQAELSEPDTVEYHQAWDLPQKLLSIYFELR